jgi:hypothetical protein
MAQGKAAPTSYDLRVRIEPASGNLAVLAKIEIPVEPGAKNFRFNLHGTFVIKKLLLEGKDAIFSSVPGEASFMLPPPQRVIVTLPAVLAQNKVHMDIEYEGRLKEVGEFGASSDQKEAMDDQINSRMVELAGYSSWYPQFTFGTPLQLALEVSLPQGWITICSGKQLENRVKEGREITRWSSPNDIDILVVASPHFKKKTFREAGTNIEIYHTQMPEAFIDNEVQQIAGVLKLYTDRLGETNIPAGTIKHVYSPKRKGQGAAGISRPGMIVTSEGRTLDSLAQDPHFSLFQGIAHEVAHFWWNFGADQGDWINEAFAEYFSSTAVQTVSGEQAFQVVLDNYRKQVRGLPPDVPSLANVPFMNDNVAFVVRYYKGSLMLHSLRQTLGDDKFFQACRSFSDTYKGKSIGTQEFRTFWKDRLGDHKALVDTWLDAKGGLPM